ncbi:MAG: FxLYD domain-containing protein [Aggregatilineales bacterium]
MNGRIFTAVRRVLAQCGSAMVLVGLFGLCISITGCQGGPLIVVATPLPPDAGFRTYRYPGGVFTIRLPADWAIHDVSSGNAIRVEFSPPDNAGLPLTVYVVNKGQPIDTTTLLDALKPYEASINGDSSIYTEIARNAQGDGSWRLTGIRQTPIGPRQLNTFIQADQSFLSAVVVDITGADSSRMAQLAAIVNTYRVNTAASLTVSSANTGTPAPNVPGVNTSAGTIAFDGLLEWADSAGGFNINGELTNRSGGPLEAVRVTALLYDSQNTILAQQGDVISSDVLPDGTTASFSIHFRDGKPPQTVRYELQSSARNAVYNLATYLGPDSFLKGNEKASYDPAGDLVISGDVVNQTQQAAHAIRVNVTVYDAQQRVVGTQSAFVAKPDLLPGETSHYEVTFYQLAGSAGRFVTRIEGRTQ